MNADEILNVKAVIKAFEDKVLGNHMDQWTIFYNGKIVDRINSYRELLWSVRNPLYKEVYGSKGSIWIEPVSAFSLDGIDTCYIHIGTHNFYFILCSSPPYSISPSTTLLLPPAKRRSLRAEHTLVPWSPSFPSHAG